MSLVFNCRMRCGTGCGTLRAGSCGRSPSRRCENLRGNGRFVTLDAIQGGNGIAKRGFYLHDPAKGEVERHR